MGKYGNLKSHFIIISLIVFLTKINSYVILPLDYLPDQNYKFLEGDNNIQTKSKEEFMKQLYFKKLITKFEIGTRLKLKHFF